MQKVNWQNWFLGLVTGLFFGLGSWARFQGLFSLGYVFDTVSTQFEWGKSAFELGGLFNFWQNYPLNKFYDYPPLSLVYEWGIAFLVNFFKGGLEGNQLTFVQILKITNWSVEILLFGFLAWLGKKYGGLKWSMSVFFSSVVYTLPSFWFVSAFWGQNDTLIALISFLSLFYLVNDNTKQSIGWQKFLPNNFLLSGALLAIGFNIKQQPILIIPAILVFFSQSKSFWQLVKTAILSGLPILPVYYLVNWYVENYEIYDFRNRSLTELGLSQSINQGLIYLSIFILCYLLGLFILEIRKTESQRLVKFLLGFWSSFWIIQLPLFWLNPIRSMEILAVSAIRDDNVSEGANTFWTLLDQNFTRSRDTALDYIIQSDNFQISVSSLSTLTYLSFMIVFCWFLFGLNYKLAFIWNNGFKIGQIWCRFKELTFKQLTKIRLGILELSMLISLSNFSYFLFMTKIHSRYLHLGLVFMFISFFVWDKKEVRERWRWLGVSLLTSIPYFLNQVWVYGYTNSDPAWVRIWLESVKFKIGNLNSAIYLLSFFWLYFIAINVVKRTKTES